LHSQWLRVGTKQKQKKTVNDALIASENIKNEAYKAMILSKIAVVLNQVGSRAKSEEIVNNALSIAEKIKSNSEAMRGVAVVMAQLGKFEMAMAAVEKIEDSYHKAEALREVAVAMAQLGKFEIALEVADKIKEEAYKAHTLIKIAMVLAQVGSNAKAEEIMNNALSIAEKITNNILESYYSQAIQEIMRIAKNEQFFDNAMSIFGDKFALLQFGGRNEVFRRLVTGVPLITAWDKSGQTLWKVYRAIEEVDGWWDV